MVVKRSAKIGVKGKDAEDFWENERNPKVTKEQIKMFKEAMQIYKTHIKA
jgi:hypothetical protein